MPTPDPEPEAQVQFLFKVQRLLSEGSFVSTYKYALLLALADLSVERGDDLTETLPIDTIDLAERFVTLYWRQVLPWIPPGGAGPAGRRLAQNAGGEAAIIQAIARAHRRYEGSLARLRRDRAEWLRLLREVARTIAVMPLWRLQTVGDQRLDFLYPNVGRGRKIEIRGEAVYCFRRFRDLIGDLTENAWVRFVRRLRPNRELLGDRADLREFLFGSDRASLGRFCPVLHDLQNGRCFYCDRRLKTEGAVDHFIPWSRYPLDLGHNLVLADTRCNAAKADRLAAFDHLERWSARNRDPVLNDAFATESLPHGRDVTERVASWAYGQAEQVHAHVWLSGPDGLTDLDPRWRRLPGMRPPP